MKNTSRALMICAGLMCSLQVGFLGTECLATPLAAPTDLSASDGANIRREVAMTWIRNAASDFTIVWRNTSAETSTAKQVNTTYSNTFTDTNVVRGVVYYYWVQAANDDGETSVFSTPDTGYAGALPAPTGVKASGGTNTTRAVAVAWDYYFSSETLTHSVWRNTSAETSTATQVGTVYYNSCSFTDSNVVRGVVYHYWTRRLLDGDASDFSAPDTGYASTLPAPTDVLASDGCIKNVRVTWQYPDGYSDIVENFSVWRGPSNSTAAAELIGSVAYGDGGGGNTTPGGHIFTNVNVATGTVYYYWVRAADDYGDASDFSTPDTGYTRPLSVVNDFDGDGRSDVVVYRDGFWSIYSIANGVICYDAGPWGAEYQFPVPGDYDGDGRFDAAVAIWRSSWSIYSLTRGIILTNYVHQSHSSRWGTYVPGDYDGDGAYDLGEYASDSSTPTWFAFFTYTFWNFDSFNLGSKFDIPVPGDYDGDGKYDFAVYNNGYWSIYSHASGVICDNAGPWGGENGIPVPGDYDGDGKSDLAVYQNGYWSIYSIANGIICYEAGPWGGEDCIPVPGDYDGDGKSDAAFYREGYWSIYSMAGHVICNSGGPWGGIGYIPLGTGLRRFNTDCLLEDLNTILNAGGYSAAASFVAKTVRIGDGLDGSTIIDLDVYDGTIGRYIKGDGYSKAGARYISVIYGPTQGAIMFIAYFSLY